MHNLVLCAFACSTMTYVVVRPIVDVSARACGELKGKVCKSVCSAVFPRKVFCIGNGPLPFGLGGGVVGQDGRVGG